MLALTSATGKLGSAVINALISNTLLPPVSLVICTSSSPSLPQFSPLRAQGAIIRLMTYDSPTSMESAFSGCTSLLLISSPHIAMDFNAAPPGTGREAHHIAAIAAARKAGVAHVYYTSLAFGAPSKAGVMVAHLRTEAYLAALAEEDAAFRFTVLREGLYSESWPLYLGYFDVGNEEREEVVVAGDGAVSWTAIADMAFATAIVLAAPRGKWVGRTVYLAQRRAMTLKEVARVVGEVRGKGLRVKVVEREEYERFYVEEMGRERDAVRWWSSTYDALKEGECEIKDETLENILREAGRQPKRMEETVREMLG